MALHASLGRDTTGALVSPSAAQTDLCFVLHRLQGWLPAGYILAGDSLTEPQPGPNATEGPFHLPTVRHVPPLRIATTYCCMLNHTLLCWLCFAVLRLSQEQVAAAPGPAVPLAAQPPAAVPRQPPAASAHWKGALA